MLNINKIVSFVVGNCFYWSQFSFVYKQQNYYVIPCCYYALIICNPTPTKPWVGFSWGFPRVYPVVSNLKLTSAVWKIRPFQVKIVFLKN